MASSNEEGSDFGEEELTNREEARAEDRLNAQTRIFIDWLTFWSLSKNNILRAGVLVARLFIVFVGVTFTISTGIALTTYTFHTYLPWRWLEMNEYPVVADIAFPILLVTNSWLIYWATSRSGRHGAIPVAERLAQRREDSPL